MAELQNSPDGMIIGKFDSLVSDTYHGCLLGYLHPFHVSRSVREKKWWSVTSLLRPPPPPPLRKWRGFAQAKCSVFCGIKSIVHFTAVESTQFCRLVLHPSLSSNHVGSALSKLWLAVPATVVELLWPVLSVELQSSRLWPPTLEVVLLG